jgi:hypothetical protein
MMGVAVVSGMETRREIHSALLVTVYVAVLSTAPGNPERPLSWSVKVMLSVVCAVTVQFWTS